MAQVLFAPELVVMWAVRQHRDAKVLTEEFQIKGRPGWTKTHAFFLIMGGFTLYKRGKPLRVLEWRDLQVLAGAGRIAWPDIAEEEINDRSKGDYLSKGIVVLQTTWFIVQFIARAASKLTITELEVVTLAFSTLIGVIYYSWWDKPLDVRRSVPVHLVELNMEQTTSDNIMDEDFSPKDFCFCCLVPLNISPIVVKEVEGNEEGEFGVSNRCVSLPLDSRSPGSLPHIQDFNSIPTSIKDSTPEPPPPQTDFPRRPASNFSWMKRLHLRIQDFNQKHGTGTFAGLFYVLVNQRLYSSFGNLSEVLETDTREPDDQPSNTALRVPTFYSSSTDGLGARLIVGVGVSILFGVIHCIAWYAEFPSSPERWGWRISAIVVSVVPLVLLSLFMVGGMRIVEESSLIFQIFAASFIWLYMVSRIALLVLPLIALRALPRGAYVDLDWATIIPHI